MRNKKNAILAFAFFSILFGWAQDSAKISITWRKLYDGMEYCEADAPFKSILNNSKISILKINPEKFEFQLLTASEHDSTQTAVEWADNFGMNVIINAGMYDLTKKLINKGYMQNYKHLNNPDFNPSYGAVIAFNPNEKKIPNFKIIDVNCDRWDSIKPYYNSYSQGMRMLDCNGNPLTWNKKNQSCSMLLASCDEEGNLYYVFSRSPYTHNEMIRFLLSMPFKMVNAIYLEGGPETSLYIDIGNTQIKKIGSYISNSYPNDDNDHFWKLPNVIGLKPKK
jgi:hypothetical protein